MKNIVLILMLLALPLELLAASTWEDGLEMYKQGNKVNAIKIWTKLAEKGDVTSQLTLGKGYIKGSFGEKNKEESFVWFSKAAELGDKEAQYFLAILQIELKNNYSEAKKLLKKSSNQGFTIATSVLEKLKEMEKNRDQYKGKQNILESKSFGLFYKNVSEIICN